MVVLKIKALTEKGHDGLLKVGRMKAMRLAKIFVVKDKPLTVHIVYGQSAERFLQVDAMLQKFAIERGLQMAREVMEQHNCTENDYTAEVVLFNGG